MVRLPDAAGQVRNAPIKVLRGLFAGIGQLLLAADRFRAEEAERERDVDGEHRDPLTAPESWFAAGSAPVIDSGLVTDSGPVTDSGQRSPESAGRAPAGVADSDPARASRRFRSLDSTGNVRVLTPDEIADAAPEPVATTAPEPTATIEPGPVRPAGGQKAARKPKPPARSKPKPQTRTKPHARPEPDPEPAPAPAVPPELPVPGYDGLSLPSLRARLRSLDADQLRILVEYEKSAARRPEVVTMFERRIARLEATAPDAS